MSVGESVGAVVESFYTRHVLRDLLGKMAPGTLFLIGLRSISSSFDVAIGEVTDASFAAWLVFAVLAWVAGISLQGLGSMTGRCKFLPMQYSMRQKGESRKNADAGFSKTYARLYSASSVTKDAMQGVERLVVIKEATGNLWLAVSLLIPLAAWKGWDKLECLAPSLLVTTVLWAGLWLFHPDAVRSQDELIRNVLEPGKN